MKGYGYLVSILSVALLMIPPLKSAKEDPVILLCLVAGAALSVVGMFMRWLADRRTQRRIDHAQEKGDAALDRTGSVVRG